MSKGETMESLKHAWYKWSGSCSHDSIPVSQHKTKQNQFNAPSPKTSPTAAMLSQQTEFQA